MAEENQEELKPTSTDEQVAEGTHSGETLAHAVAPNVDSQAGNASGTEAGKRGNRAQKVGVVASDKMEKTVVVRVDRLIKHPKYRRYVRRTSKFMAHDETGATIGDKVRIVETRPLSARKRWRVVEIVQKAEK
jgi:small subunit ribosomal protein S17